MASIAAMKPAIVIFVLVTVGVNMLALGYIAFRAQQETADTQEECHQLEELVQMIRQIRERLPVRP